MDFAENPTCTYYKQLATIVIHSVHANCSQVSSQIVETQRIFRCKGRYDLEDWWYHTTETIRTTSVDDLSRRGGSHSWDQVYATIRYWDQVRVDLTNRFELCVLAETRPGTDSKGLNPTSGTQCQFEELNRGLDAFRRACADNLLLSCL